MSGHGCTPGLQQRLDQAYLVPLEPSLGVWGLLEVRSTAGTLKACESYTWGHSVDTGPTLFIISLSHTHSQHRHSAWLQQSELWSASQFMKRSNLVRIKLTWNLCLLCNPDTVQRCSVKKVFLIIITFKKRGYLSKFITNIIELCFLDWKPFNFPHWKTADLLWHFRGDKRFPHCLIFNYSNYIHTTSSMNNYWPNSQILNIQKYSASQP